MMTPARWTVVVFVMFVAAVPALAIPPELDPTVESGTVVIDGVSLDFHRQGALLPNTASYASWYGCAPTAAGMMMGFYDRNGYLGVQYPNLVPGGTAEATTFSGTPPFLANGAIASAGHISDFYADGDGGWGDDNSPSHSFDCLADFMGTSQDACGNGNGNTTFWNYTSGARLTPADLYGSGESYWQTDGMYGVGEYVTCQGYGTAQLYSQYIRGRGANPDLGFTFDDYRAEIDAGRPVIIQLEGHTVLGIGYTGPDTVTLYDTWAEEPGTMAWGGSYAGMVQYGVMAMELTPEPASMALVGLGLLGLLLRRKRGA